MRLLPALDGAYGDRPDAVTVGPETVSWAGLAAAADATAALIAGAPAVAVHADASLHTIVAVVAGLRAGIPVVPVAADSGPAEVAYMLADSGATLLLRDGAVTSVPSAGEAAAPPPGTALVVYTSGTTGRPKGVLLGTEALAADLDALADAWAWTAEDTLVHGLPLFHVHGLVLGVLGALRHGCRLVHTVRPTPAAYAGAGAGGTLYFGVPTVWSRICAEPAAARALGGARLLVSGSAPLPGPVFEALAELSGHRPVERYGMTETLITCSTRAGGPRRPGVVGQALAGVRTRVAAVADGDGLGELEVGGPTLFSGYLHRPDATATSFTPDGWFRTGDIAVIDEEGTHRIVGRASIDLIKTGGFKVGAGEIEDALLAHPAVVEAAVVGAPHDDLGQEIVAYVVAAGVDGSALAEFVAARLSWHKRPRRIEFVAALPRNAMGKVQKSLLK